MRLFTSSQARSFRFLLVSSWGLPLALLLSLLHSPACGPSSSQDGPPTETSLDQETERPTDSKAEPPAESPTDSKAEPPAERPTDSKAEPPAESPAEIALDAASEKPDLPPERSPETSPDGPPAPWVDPTIHQGQATFYEADGSGACSFPSVPAPLVAAMNSEEYASASFCGACIRVQGPRGSVTVRVTDLCPECKKGHLDLSREAFAQIADPILGVVPISWQVVTCDLQGPLHFFYKDGSSQWWTAIQVRNHRLPLRSLEIWKGGTWKDLPRQSYNFFLDASGSGTQPIRLRLTAWSGQILEETLPPPASALLVTGKQQF